MSHLVSVKTKIRSADALCQAIRKLLGEETPIYSILRSSANTVTWLDPFSVKIVQPAIIHVQIHQYRFGIIQFRWEDESTSYTVSHDSDIGQILPEGRSFIPELKQAYALEMINEVANRQGLEVSSVTKMEDGRFRVIATAPQVQYQYSGSQQQYQTVGGW